MVEMIIFICVVVMDVVVVFVCELMVQYGLFMFYQLGGCCDGFVFMCYLVGMFFIGVGDVFFGVFDVGFDEFVEVFMLVL